MGERPRYRRKSVGKEKERGRGGRETWIQERKGRKKEEGKVITGLNRISSSHSKVVTQEGSERRKDIFTRSRKGLPTE